MHHGIMQVNDRMYNLYIFLEVFGSAHAVQDLQILLFITNVYAAIKVFPTIISEVSARRNVSYYIINFSP